MDRKEERHVRAYRPLYRRHFDLVVVKPLRISSKTVLEPGSEIDRSKHPEFHLRSLYRRGFLGPKGHPWTALILEKTGHKLKREAARKEEAGKEVPSRLMDWLRRAGILSDVPEYGEHEGAGIQPTGEN